jgi:hypothetical protein
LKRSLAEALPARELGPPLASSPRSAHAWGGIGKRGRLR